MLRNINIQCNVIVNVLLSNLRRMFVDHMCRTLPSAVFYDQDKDGKPANSRH